MSDADLVDAQTPLPDTGQLPGPRDSGPVDAGLARDSGPTSTDQRTDTRRFVPDIPRRYEGTVTMPGVEIVAMTIKEDPLLRTVTYYVALQNNSTSLRLCSLDMTTRFLDASGRELAQTLGLVECPVHRGSAGRGSLLNCLSPGQIGMQARRVNLGSGSSVTSIASMAWRVGAINLTDAVPSSNIVATGVMTSDIGGGAQRFVGRVENRGTAAAMNPGISVFAVNAVGRPYVESSTSGITTLSPGGSWPFETIVSFTDLVAATVSFPEASD